MTSLLFEQPLTLGLLLATILAVLAWVWTRTRTTGAGRALLTGLILAPLLLAVQAWVVTDREKLEAAIRQMSAWVEKGNVKGIVSLIDPAATFAGGQDLAEFEKHLTWLLEKYEVQDPQVGGFEIAWNTGRADVTCAAFCQVGVPQGQFPVRSRWQLQFRLINGTWKVTDLRPISIMDRRYESFFDIN